MNGYVRNILWKASFEIDMHSVFSAHIILAVLLTSEVKAISPKAFPFSSRLTMIKSGLLRAISYLSEICLELISSSPSLRKKFFFPNGSGIRT